MSIVFDFADFADIAARMNRKAAPVVATTSIACGTTLVIAQLPPYSPSDLYDACRKYTAGEGSRALNLPDLRGRVLV